MKSVNVLFMSTVLIITAVITTMATGGGFLENVLSFQKVYAQVSGEVVSKIQSDNGMRMGYNGTMMHGAGGAKFTGSIKLSSIIGSALGSQIKVGLSQAVLDAEKSVGTILMLFLLILEYKMDFWCICSMGSRWEL